MVFDLQKKTKNKKKSINGRHTSFLGIRFYIIIITLLSCLYVDCRYYIFELQELLLDSFIFLFFFFHAVISIIPNTYSYFHNLLLHTLLFLRLRCTFTYIYGTLYIYIHPSHFDVTCWDLEPDIFLNRDASTPFRKINLT